MTLGSGAPCFTGNNRTLEGIILLNSPLVENLCEIEPAARSLAEVCPPAKSPVGRGVFHVEQPAPSLRRRRASSPTR